MVKLIRLGCMALTVFFLSFTLAQTIGFNLSTLTGRYIGNLLTSAEIKIIDCPFNEAEAALALPPQTDDYLCIEDIGGAPFRTDIDSFLKKQPGIVKESSGWYPVNDSTFQHIIFRDGYDLALAIDSASDLIIVLGDSGQ